MFSTITEKILSDTSVYTGSAESIEVVEELEHRRNLVSKGQSKLIDENDSFEFLKSSGCHV